MRGSSLATRLFLSATALVVVGGFAESMVTGTPNGPRIAKINERIESDWWGTEGKRDYFIARHEQNGTLCWVFRDHHSRRWFLHGLFG